jgi:hypothetical protein
MACSGDRRRLEVRCLVAPECSRRRRPGLGGPLRPLEPEAQAPLVMARDEPPYHCPPPCRARCSARFREPKRPGPIEALPRWRFRRPASVARRSLRRSCLRSPSSSCSPRRWPAPSPGSRHRSHRPGWCRGRTPRSPSPTATPPVPGLDRSGSPSVRRPWLCTGIAVGTRVPASAIPQRRGSRPEPTRSRSPRRARTGSSTTSRSHRSR